MARRRQLLDDIEESSVAVHKPKHHKHHIGTEYISSHREVGPSRPIGKIGHSRARANRELVRHLKQHLQDRVLFPVELKKGYDGSSRTNEAAA